MAHYALLDENNIVVSVLTGRDEDETVEGISDWETYYGEFHGKTCKRTSYNTYGGVHYTDGEPSADQSKAFRLNYAGIGFSYDVELDGFIPPKPFPSWSLNAGTGLWEAPVPFPDESKIFYWNEETQEWVEVPE